MKKHRNIFSRLVLSLSIYSSLITRFKSKFGIGTTSGHMGVANGDGAGCHAGKGNLDSIELLKSPKLTNPKRTKEIVFIFFYLIKFFKVFFNHIL